MKIENHAQLIREFTLLWNESDANMPVTFVWLCLWWIVRLVTFLTIFRWEFSFFHVKNIRKSFYGLIQLLLRPKFIGGGHGWRINRKFFLLCRDLNSLQGFTKRWIFNIRIFPKATTSAIWHHQFLTSLKKSVNYVRLCLNESLAVNFITIHP